jgi:hypothetical protein
VACLLEMRQPGYRISRFFSPQSDPAAAVPLDLDFRDDFAPPLARRGSGAVEALFGKAERTILRS